MITMNQKPLFLMTGIYTRALFLIVLGGLFIGPLWAQEAQKRSKTGKKETTKTIVTQPDRPIFDPGVLSPQSPLSGISFLNNNNDTLVFIGDNGNVGIGTSAPGYRLHVVETAETDSAAIVGENTTGIPLGLGTGVRGLGGKIGVEGVVVGSDNHDHFYGVKGLLKGSSDVGYNYGVHGSIKNDYVGNNPHYNYGIYGKTESLSATAFSAGVFGKAIGQGVLWAGYFDGRVFVNDTLEVNNTIYTTSGGVKFPDGTVQTSAATAMQDSVSTNDTAFRITNTGLGGAGFFRVNNPLNSSIALEAKSNGSGPALTVSALGGGLGARFITQSSSNTNPTIAVEHRGAGATIMAQATSGSALGGVFRSIHAANPNPAVDIEHRGAGATIMAQATSGSALGGVFRSIHAANPNPAVDIEHRGAGATIMAQATSGSALGGVFRSIHAANPNPAVDIEHRGAGATIMAQATSGSALGGVFRSIHAANPNPAVDIEHRGAGATIMAQATSGSALGGVFRSIHAANPNPAVDIKHYGLGGSLLAQSMGAASKGAQFITQDSNNPNPAVEVISHGTSSGLLGIMRGPAEVARLKIENSNNSSPALLVETNGSGPAARFMGNMEVSQKLGVGLSAPPSQPLHVNGIIYSSNGGFKFPDGSVQISAAAGGTGDITAVHAGLGLTGGGTVGEVTISHAPHSGDVSGTTSLQVRGLWGRSISPTPPATGQVLKWISGQWRPSSDIEGDNDWIISGNDVYRSNGNVGILQNSSTPRSKLNVEGQIRIEEGNAPRLTFPLAGVNMWNIDNENGTLRFFRENYSTIGTGSGGIRRMVLSDAGKLGVGTSIPEHRVHVVDTSEANLTAAVYADKNVTGGNDDRHHYGVYSTITSVESNPHAVHGKASGGAVGYGIYGESAGSRDFNFGVYGRAHGSNLNYGIYGSASGGSTNWAGYFNGNVNVTDSLSISNGGLKVRTYYGSTPLDAKLMGNDLFFYRAGSSYIRKPNGGLLNIDADLNVIGNLSKGGGSFKIDHPLEPKEKYLYHSFVESPDMMNVYNGNVRMDSNGEAWVELPEWFEALNKEFRYQLTCIGGYARVYVAEEVHQNRFKIAGGKTGLKVSWQVTGIRHDPYAEKHRIPVEENKPAAERGKFLHPDAYGQPAMTGIHQNR